MDLLFPLFGLFAFIVALLFGYRSRTKRRRTWGIWNDDYDSNSSLIIPPLLNKPEEFISIFPREDNRQHAPSPDHPILLIDSDIDHLDTVLEGGLLGSDEPISIFPREERHHQAPPSNHQILGIDSDTHHDTPNFGAGGLLDGGTHDSGSTSPDSGGGFSEPGGGNDFGGGGDFGGAGAGGDWGWSSSSDGDN